MKENEIIEKIHKIYDVKEPDVLTRLDFSMVEMQSVPERNIRKRYISAVAIYAAVCLVITATLPFIIGGKKDNPAPNPSNSAINKETVLTGDKIRDDSRLIEYNTDTVTETAAEIETEEVTTPEETTVSETTAPEDVSSNDVYYVPEETVTPAETGEPEQTDPPVNTEEAVQTTPSVPEDTGNVTYATEPVVTEPEVVDPTPENMVEDKIDIPYTLIRYSGGWVDSLTSLLECDVILEEYGYSETDVTRFGLGQTTNRGTDGNVRVIKTKNQFDTLAAQITNGLEADLVNEGAFAEFAKDFEYFDEEYFDNYELVFMGFGESVHGIEYQVNNWSYDEFTTDGRHHFFIDNEYFNNEFWINIVKKLPPAGEVISADIAAENRTTELVLIAFDKDDVKDVQDEKRVCGTSIVYQGPAPEDGKNMSDIDKFYYQAPYTIDVTEEEALEMARQSLHFAQGSNVYPYTDGDYLEAASLTNMYDYTCELSEWNGFPVYNITFYSANKSYSTVYKVTLQVYANERCVKSSIVRNRMNDPRDATAKRDEDYVVAERATPSVVWMEKDGISTSTESVMYTYYEYADSTTMGELWALADPENSEYNVTYGRLVNGLPYLVFDNYSDYSKFIRTVKADYAEGSEAYDFLKDSEKYDEEYFENNVLAIVGIKNKDKSVDNRMTISMYEGFKDENARRLGVNVTSYIPGFEGEISDKYEFSEDDEIEYKMYVFEFACEEDAPFEFSHASFRNYNSDDSASYTPYEDRKTYYVNKNK